MPPQRPTIVPSLQVAREGQEFQLSCASSGANPEPNITWFRNEQPISIQQNGQQVKIEQLRLNQTSTSILSWIPTIDDHNAIFKCSVYNKAMQPGQTLEREHLLQVECK